MTKQDLQTGHIITTRRGNRYFVFRNLLGCSSKLIAFSIDRCSHMDLDTHSDDMKWGKGELDIMKVEVIHKYTGGYHNMADKSTVIWERKEEPTIELIVNGKPIEMSDETLAAIKKALK